MTLKDKIRAHGFRQWEVAEKCGVTEFTLSRWLRRPEQLDAERTARVEQAIEQLLDERRSLIG